jgi:hypothetical protein
MECNPSRVSNSAGQSGTAPVVQATIVGGGTAPSSGQGTVEANVVGVVVGTPVAPPAGGYNAHQNGGEPIQASPFGQPMQVVAVPEQPMLRIGPLQIRRFALPQLIFIALVIPGIIVIFFFNRSKGGWMQWAPLILGPILIGLHCMSMFRRGAIRLNRSS